MPISGTLKKIDLNITNQCNLRCSHCVFNSGHKSENCSFAEIEKFLTEARSIGASRIDITGGEALTREDIFDIIALAKSLGYRIELLSNGIALSDEVIKRLLSLKLDAVGISLESLDYETNKKIRPTTKEQFELIIDNIKACVKAGFYTKVNSVVFTCNYHGFKDLALWCQKNNIAEYGIYYLTTMGRGSNIPGQVLAPDVWLDYVRTELHPIADLCNISIETAWLEPQAAAKIDVSCFIKRPHHIQILPTGNIYPCAIMSVHDKALGNIKQESIIDIWKDDKRWADYNHIVDELFAKYRGCVDYSSCGNDTSKYAFVCPCSKYSSTELLAP